MTFSLKGLEFLGNDQNDLLLTEGDLLTRRLAST